MHECLGPTISESYLAISHYVIQIFRCSLERKFKGRVFRGNEHVSLELPMKGAIARLIETSPSVALAFGQTETGPASRVSEPPDAGKGFG